MFIALAVYLTKGMGGIMYIKSIHQFIKEHTPLKTKLSEGNSIYGKIISQDGKNGLIKLSDGTIIPTIFLSENKLVNDKFLKFLIEQFDSSGLYLRLVDDARDLQGEDSINFLITKLNIPKEEGTKIINSLIRFNLPATDENIMKIYKNINFIDNLGKMEDKDILSFLSNNVKGDFTLESKEFGIAREILSKLLEVDADFLSLLIENDIPCNIEGMLKTSNFLKNNFNMNNIINAMNNLQNMDTSTAVFDSYKGIIGELINNQELLPILNDYFEGNLFPEGEKYITARDAFTRLSNINSDYMSELIQRRLPDILRSMTEASSPAWDNGSLNNLAKEIGNLIKENGSELFLFSFRDIIKELAEKPDFLLQLKNYLTVKQASGNSDFGDIQNSLARPLNMGSDYISTLLKNRLSPALNNIADSSGLSRDAFNMDKVISTLKSILDNNDRDLSLISLNNTLKEALDKPEVLNRLPDHIMLRFSEDLEVLKLLSNNYNIYFYNSYRHEKLFKNNIIIKNKYKANSSINPDDVKVFITVDTPNIGVIESYLYKKGTSLTIAIKSEEKYISLFKRSIGILNKALQDKGYNVINISVSSTESEANLISLADFFNDTIFKELDVRV